MERIIRYTVGFIKGAFLLLVRAVVSFRYNVSLAVLAVALAISLWIFVTGAENPERTGFFAGSIPVEAVNVPLDLAVASLSSSVVSVRVSAPEDVFDRLTSDDFKALVDLSGVTSKEVTLPVQVTSSRSRVKIVEASPAMVTISLEGVTSRTVSVRVETVGAAPLGFEVASSSVSPEEVTVSGPESLVGRVDAAVAEVNLTGVRVDISRSVELRARDAGGGDIEGVVIAPRSAEVKVELIQKDYSKVFLVTPTIRGAPAEGYNVTSVRVEPSVVVISGSAEVLQSIDAVQGVPTDEVNVEGARSDVTRAVRLKLPEGARVQGREDVTVWVRIAPARGRFVFSVAPQISGLSVDLEARLSGSVVQVTLAGPVATLSSLSAADITAILHLEGKPVGEHTVEVRVNVPEGATLVSVQPSEIEIVITQR